MSQINLRTLLSKTVSAIKSQLGIDSFLWSEFETKMNEAMKRDTQALISFIEGSEETINNIFVPPGTKKIKEGFLKDNTKITSVKIPDSVEEIGENAFSGCTNLTNVLLPNGLKSCGANAFFDTSFKTKSTKTTENTGYFSSGKYIFDFYVYSDGLTFEEGPETIFGPGTLSLGAGDIYLPNSLKYIKAGAFVTNGGANIHIGNNILKIEDGAFKNYSSNSFWNQVYISDLRSWLNIDFESEKANPCYFKSGKEDYTPFFIGESTNAFEKVYIPDGVTAIKNYAFYGASRYDFVIPNSVKSIGRLSFGGIKRHDIEFLDRTDIPTLDAESGLAFSSNSYKIKVPEALVSQWKVAPNWSQYASYIVGV